MAHMRFFLKRNGATSEPGFMSYRSLLANLRKMFNYTYTTLEDFQICPITVVESGPWTNAAEWLKAQDKDKPGLPYKTLKARQGRA